MDEGSSSGMKPDGRSTGKGSHTEIMVIPFICLFHLIEYELKRI